MPDRMRPPCVSGHALMAMVDGVGPSEWNEGMFSPNVTPLGLTPMREQAKLWLRLC